MEIEIDHVAMPVADIERSVEFYQRVFGAKADGLEKWRADETRAKAVHAMASDAYPFLRRIPQRIRQPSLHRHAIDQSPIGVEELAPAFLVIPVLQAGHQTPSRRNQFIRIHVHEVI